MPVVDFSADANDWQERVDKLKPDDPLFVSDGPDEWQTVARLNPDDPIHTWILMMRGYKDAADMLVESAASNSVNFLIYPVLFLYRHHIELHLKFIITIGKKYISGEAPNLRQHNLANLWKAAKQILEAAFPDDEEKIKNNEKIEGIIKQLGVVDPRSFTFRYSHDPNPKKREVYLSEDLQYVNLRHLREKLDAAIYLLDRASNGLLIFLSHTYEEQ